MPVECASCQRVQNTFWFQPPWRATRFVSLFRVAILAAAAASLWNLVQAFSPSLVEALWARITRAELDRLGDWADASQRDMAVVAEDALLNIGLVAVLLFLFVFLRSLVLLWGTRKAHPTALRKIRVIAIVQLATEVVAPLAIWFLYAGTQTYDVSFAPGFGLVTAPAVLALSGHRDVKAHFNAHRVVRAARDPQPTAQAS
jgi:hypothetical protein